MVVVIITFVLLLLHPPPWGTPIKVSIPPTHTVAEPLILSAAATSFTTTVVLTETVPQTLDKL
jgi:hypothetical protein